MNQFNQYLRWTYINNLIFSFDDLKKTYLEFATKKESSLLDSSFMNNWEYF